MKCSGDCNQGRACDCEQLDEQPTPFEMIGDFVVAGLIAVGVIVCIGIAVLALMGVAA